MDCLAKKVSGSRSNSGPHARTKGMKIGTDFAEEIDYERITWGQVDDAARVFFVVTAPSTVDVQRRTSLGCPRTAPDAYACRRMEIGMWMLALIFHSIKGASQNPIAH